MIPVLLLKTSWFWLAFGLFLFGTFTDFWDGWIARRHHLESALGRVLDPTADKIFILGTMASFAAKGVYSYWFLVPLFVREIAVTFCRGTWLFEGQAIAAEKAGKIKLGLQVTSVLFSFFYLALPTPLTLCLNYFFLIAALFMTLYSGFSFFSRHQNLLRNKRFLGTAASLGVGRLRPFPGTYGTLIGMAFLFLIAFDAFLHLIVIAAFIILGYVAIKGMGLAKEEDPREVVIDEACGILLAFWTVPLNWRTLVAGFLIFRFFDVTKVFPLRWLEQRKGVWGILLDDLGAGVYTWLILKILFR